MAQTPQTPVNKFAIEEGLWDLTTSSSGSDAAGQGNHLLPRTGAKTLSTLTPSLTPVTERNAIAPRGPSVPRNQRSTSPMLQMQPPTGGSSLGCPRRASASPSTVNRSPVPSKAVEKALRPVSQDPPDRVLSHRENLRVPSVPHRSYIQKAWNLLRLRRQMRWDYQRFQNSWIGL